MEQSIYGSIAAFPDISELFPFAFDQAYCYIHILKEKEIVKGKEGAKENEAVWFYVLYENKNLDFYYIARLPYLPQENVVERIWAILPGIIGNSCIVILEGIGLLKEIDQEFIITRLSKYSIQNEMGLFLISESLLPKKKFEISPN